MDLTFGDVGDEEGSIPFLASLFEAGLCSVVDFSRLLMNKNKTSYYRENKHLIQIYNLPHN